MLGGHIDETAQHVREKGIDGMTLRSAKLSPTGLITDDQEIDDLVCD
jgi:hypothetical protein